MSTEKKKMDVILSDGILRNKRSGKQIGDVEKVLKTRELNLVESADTELAVGVAPSQYEKPSAEYLNSIKDYSENSTDIRKQIELSNKLYKFEGTVSTGVDIIVDFIFSGFSIEVEDEAEKEVYSFFMENVNRNLKTISDFGLDSLLKEIGLEYILSGNGFPYSTWSKARVNKKEYKLPAIIQLMNPRYIEIPAPFFNIGNPIYIFNPVLSGEKMSIVEHQANLKKIGISKTQLKQLEEARPLEQDRIYHIKRKARNYDIWGIPYLTKTFSAVATKMKLRMLDNATTEGLINSVTIFKIGSPDKDSPYHIVKRSRLDAFAGLISSPQASTILVWAHDVEIDTAGPAKDILDFENKYKEVDQEIVRALGIPQILIDGTGTATAGWVAILALVQRLERVREDIAEYMKYIFDQIKIQNKFKSDVRFSWLPINLRDEKNIKNLLLSFYDKGLLPIKTTLKEGGYDADRIILEKIKEDEEGLDELFTPKLVPGSPLTQDPDNGKEPGRPEEEGGPPKKTTSAKDMNFILHSYFDQIEEAIQKDPTLFLASARISKRKIAQALEDYGHSALDKENYFLQKATIKNNGYLDALFKNILSTVGTSKSKVKIKKALESSLAKFSLFAFYSVRNINLAISLSEAKDKGRVGAYFRVDPNTSCEFCISLDDNFYTLEEILDILPIHPNSQIKLDLSDTNPILNGTHLNTTVRKHPADWSKSL
jgi:hypothetical protein